MARIKHVVVQLRRGKVVEVHEKTRYDPRWVEVQFPTDNATISIAAQLYDDSLQIGDEVQEVCEHCHQPDAGKPIH